MKTISQVRTELNAVRLPEWMIPSRKKWDRLVLLSWIGLDDVFSDRLSAREEAEQAVARASVSAQIGMRWEE